VVERWWRAGRLEDRGGSSWQREKRPAEVEAIRQAEQILVDQALAS
jgi:hypothetical protein